MSSRVRVPSFAKVNLHLQVLGRRADGYHELWTIFQTVDLADSIELELRDRSAVEIDVEGASLPRDGSNLAVRAAEEYLRRWGDGGGVSIRLRKRIPVGAGLGGGSSNAAAVLDALDRMIGPAPAAELRALARGLGADVPYFLVGGTALGTGRGDELTPLPDLPERPLWIAESPIEVLTREVFAALARGVPRLTGNVPNPRISLSVQEGELDWEIVAEGGNDLESVVLPRWPELEAVRAVLSPNARFVRLSGSGSALFALPEPGREGAPPSLPAGGRVHRARTLGRSELARRREMYDVD